MVQGWSHRSREATVGGAFVLAACLAVTSISSARSQGLLSEPVQRLHRLQNAFAQLTLKAERATTGFLEQIAALQARAEQQKATIAELTSAKATAERPLETQEQQLASITVQRDQAGALVDDMQQAMAGIEDLLSMVAAERSLLQRQLRAAQEQLLTASQRDARRRLEASLHWHLAHLEDELAHLRAYRENAHLWLEDWVLGSADALEELVVETGVDVEELIARAADEPAPGQGGPLQVAAPDEVGAGAAAADDTISGDIQRLELLQRIATTLPLASPLDQFHVTGYYGKRRDPFTRTLAYHSGLDLGAPRNAKVLATAPGQVIAAGPSGPYGNMVELDHGMGIVTRYAHLKSVAVAVGEAVEFRQAVGVVGSTGRSTSRHLHYEIRIDDRAFDPAKFLDTGRLVVGIFDASEREEAE
ncbi:MAG: peptidoglycan DD-metalloendopeptidase family protein [Geminicoccaceae bacterium]